MSGNGGVPYQYQTGADVQKQGQRWHEVEGEGANRELEGSGGALRSELMGSGVKR